MSYNFSDKLVLVIWLELTQEFQNISNLYGTEEFEAAKKYFTYFEKMVFLQNH